MDNTKSNNFQSKVIAYATLVIFIIVTIAYFIYEAKTDDFYTKEYKKFNTFIHKELNKQIQAKVENTNSIALTASYNEKIKEALLANDALKHNLDHLSFQLRKHTKYKNVWFQIIDKEGRSFYRSWTENRGDDLLQKRADIKNFLKNREITNSISIGKYDITFKTMVPIYHENEFIGIFEVLTHFNSISRRVPNYEADAIVLADKKYKDQLTFSLRNEFIDDYYVANFDAKPYLVDILRTNNIEKYLNENGLYTIDENNHYFITPFLIPDNNGEKLGYIIVFKDLKYFATSDLINEHNFIIYVTLLNILLVLLVAYFLINNRTSNILKSLIRTKTNELQKEQIYVQKILDLDENIILVTNENTTKKANKKFLEFFNFDTIEEFSLQHDTICDFIVKIDDKLISEDKTIDGFLWTNYLLSTQDNQSKHTITILYNNNYYLFTSFVDKFDQKGNIILTLQNVTDLKKRDKLLYEKSKLATIGELIKNVAHQWRQPLSSITVGATGILLQKQTDLLTDNYLENTCEKINENAQRLSTNIEQFVSIIRGDDTKTIFYLDENIKKTIHLLDPAIKLNNIELILNIQHNIPIEGFYSELLQSLSNVITNSIEATSTNEEINEHLIFITAHTANQKIIMNIKDNGGGIKEAIMAQVFDAYFSTKDGLSAKGLGLYYTYNSIVNGMGGDIEISNTEYSYQEEEYKGVNFKITLPYKSIEELKTTHEEG